MKEIEIVVGCLQKAGRPLTDDQQILLAGAMGVVLEQRDKAYQMATERGIDAAMNLEREACAKVAEKYGYDNFCGKTTDPIATLIRAKGKA